MLLDLYARSHDTCMQALLDMDADPVTPARIFLRSYTQIQHWHCCVVVPFTLNGATTQFY